MLKFASRAAFFMLIVSALSLYTTNRSLLDGDESFVHRRDEAAQLRLVFTDTTHAFRGYNRNKKTPLRPARNGFIKIRSAHNKKASLVQGQKVDSKVHRMQSTNTSTTQDTLCIPGQKVDSKVHRMQSTNASTAQDTPFIPDALLPVTFEGCCEPEKEDLFPQTCLTEKACNHSSLYPFTSDEEAAMFRKWNPTKLQAFLHRKSCNQANAKLRPQHKWCPNNNDMESFPFGCSRANGMGGGSGPYDRLYLYPSGRLALCGIPKAGITQWLHFLRFTIGSKDYQSIPYCKLDADQFRLDGLTPDIQEQVWKDESWTKAIFLRDPAERLLSAYLDKVQTKEGQRKPPPFGYNVSFAAFIDILSSNNVEYSVNETFGAMTGLSWMSDPHWRPQAWSCGLSENVSKFDYIGTLDKAALHSKELLQTVNMWETFGKHYRVTERGKHKGYHAAVTYPPDPLKPGQVAAGFQQQVADDLQGGITTRHSHSSWTKMKEYYTPTLLEKVKKLYWMDFALWDAVQKAHANGKVRGEDIAPILNPSCVPS